MEKLRRDNDRIGECGIEIIEKGIVEYFKVIGYLFVEYRLIKFLVFVMKVFFLSCWLEEFKDFLKLIFY